MRLLLSQHAYDTAASEIALRLPSVVFITMDGEGNFREGARVLAPANVQANIVWGSGDVLTGAHIRNFLVAVLKSEDLRWFQSSAAGYDHPVFRLVSEKGVPITSSHANAVAIAEHILCSVFAIFQNVPGRLAAQATHRWERVIFREIFSTHWLIVGYGHIGTALGLRLKALGAHVSGVRRHPTGEEKGADAVYRNDELHTLLPQADVVVICAPGGSETENLVDERFLKAMKTGAVLVNIARGTLIDEAALLKALDSGAPAFAHLDVLREEPFSPDNPFWDHPRVHLTPHIAGGGDQTLARGQSEFLENLALFVAGKQLNNLVPPEIIPEKTLPFGI